jgi:hypothetical protein
MNRIAIIGNAAGGKSTLARALSTAAHNIPLLVIDYVQYGPNCTNVAEAEVTAGTTTSLPTRTGSSTASVPGAQLSSASTWPIPSSSSIIRWRFSAISPPSEKSQVPWAKGFNEPPGCRFADVTKRMYQSIFFVHDHVRAKIIASLDRYRSGEKVITITSPEELDRMAMESFHLGAWRS